jgi:hypothetical protein
VVIDRPGERVVVCFACGWRESATPSLRPAVQKMADHNVEVGCSTDDVLVVPADRIQLLRN